MKELLLRAARYNAWANEQFIQLMQALSEEVLDRDIPSSFSSLRKTVLHIWGAEDIWLQRFEGLPKPAMRAAAFAGDTTELFESWRQASEALVRFTNDLPDDAALLRIVHSVSLAGEPIADPLNAGLQHVFNHSTFHRGQLVTMLRQAGVMTIPRTDLIVFARRRIPDFAS